MVRPTREADILATQSETRVANVANTLLLLPQSQVTLRCMVLRLHCIICAGNASFLRDSIRSDRVDASQFSIQQEQT